MIEKHMDEIFKIYESKAVRYKYLFRSPRHFSWFIYTIFTSIIIGTVNIIIFSNSKILSNLYWALIYFAFYFIALVTINKLMDARVKAEFDMLFPEKINNEVSYTKAITLFYIQRYITEHDLISVNIMKVIINSFYKKAEQVSYRSLQVIGVIAVVILPFWTSFIDLLIKDVKKIEEAYIILKIMVVAVTVVLILYYFYLKIENEVLDVLNEKSKKYFRLANILEEYFVLPIEIEKENISERLLAGTSELNNNLKLLYYKNKRKRVRLR